MKNKKMIKKLAGYPHYWISIQERDPENPEGDVTGALNNVAYRIEREEKVLVSGPIVKTLKSATYTTTRKRKGKDKGYDVVQVPRYPMEKEGPVSPAEVAKLRKEGKVTIIPDADFLLNEKPKAQKPAPDKEEAKK